MRHFSGLFWFVVVMAAGIGNFVVKQSVQNLDDELNAVRRKTVAEQREIHELNTAWTTLNQPELLADLNNRYVHLVSVSTRQVVASIEAVPLRSLPPAAPQAEFAPQVAAAPATPPATAAMPTPVAATNPPAQVARAPIVPVSATVPARPAPASLDALFAQVAGDR
jgi:hypothetical protein